MYRVEVAEEEQIQQGFGMLRRSAFVPRVTRSPGMTNRFWASAEGGFLSVQCRLDFDLIKQFFRILSFFFKLASRII